MNFIKKCPLFIAVALIFVVCLLFGFAERNTLYNSVSSAETTPASYVFEGMKEGIYPWSSVEEENVEINLASNDKTLPTDIEEVEEEPHDEQAEEIAKEPVEEEPETVTYDFMTVNNSYFDDALFIGDSRTVGLSMYSELTNATYYADVGESVYRMFKDNLGSINGSPALLEDALAVNKFAKIYFSTGINEMGTGTPESFGERYKEAIDRIRELQPDAVIFVQSIINVGPSLNASNPTFNNENVRLRNEQIKKLEDKVNVFYIDANEVLCDENGCLAEEYSNDGLHLKAKYYYLWTDFLKSKGIVKGNMENTGLPSAEEMISSMTTPLENKTEEEKTE